ncbi:hypothetical protein ACE6H2_001191 [Prunus campanulata]
MDVFIVAWLEQQVGGVVIEKGILHVSQALFRPRDEGLPPIRTDFLVNLLPAQGASRPVTKMVRTTWIFAALPTDGAKC